MCHDDPAASEPKPGESERENMFAFISSRVNITAELPFVLIRNHILRRATDSDILEIKYFLDKMAVAAEFRYEGRWNEKGQHEDLFDSDRRYFVIERDKKESLVTGAINEGFRSIELASLLAGVWIRCPVIFYPGGGVSCGGTEGHDTFRDIPEKWTEVHELGEAELDRIEYLTSAIPHITKQFDVIGRAIETFRQVSLIPSAHVLYPLGLFSVIEMLLTHNPAAEHDSLTHQIVSKFPLLNKRFRKPIDYSLFKGALPDTVWKALYGYRSVIAHGGQIIFKEGKLKVLGDAAAAHRFLHGALLALLQHALEEPELILDLRGV